MCKTFGPIHIFFLGTCYGTQFVSNDLAAYGKFEVLLIGASLGYLDRLEVGCTEGTELWLSDGIVLVTTLGAVGGLPLVTYDRLGLVQAEGSADGAVVGKFEGLPIGA